VARSLFLVVGDVKEHNFGEEAKEEVLEDAFDLCRPGTHLLIAFFEESEVVVYNCKEDLVRAIDDFTIVDFQNLSVGLVREGVLAGLQRIERQYRAVVRSGNHDSVLSACLELVEEGLHEVEQLVD
jgi:hypothetical protein